MWAVWAGVQSTATLESARGVEGEAADRGHLAWSLLAVCVGSWDQQKEVREDRTFRKLLQAQRLQRPKLTPVSSPRCLRATVHAL